MRIPITMCHGIRPASTATVPHPLPAEHFDRLMKIAADMGFKSINYDDLAAWREGSATLPERPIMIDFDHSVTSMRHGVLDILDRYGFKGNLFIYTSPYDETYDRPLALSPAPEHMTWEEIRELRDAGWHMGAHIITHPNLSELSLEDPSGEILRTELDRCNQVIQENLGFTPKDFAFTGTSWSSSAEQELMKRYRFGRLWIIGSGYQADSPVGWVRVVAKADSLRRAGGRFRAGRGRWWTTKLCPLHYRRKPTDRGKAGSQEEHPGRRSRRTPERGGGWSQRP